MSEVKIIRLTSGEELIAKVEETDTHVKLNKPAILIPAGKDQLAFGQWLPYANLKEGIEISKKYVVFNVSPIDEMASQYEEAFGSGLVVPKKSGVISGAPMPGAESLKIGDYN
jgi:hypothetical protein|tara:strand:+ start:3614 stop:3952 length:339 start_codon:yes stop_codon:yes gene_type:complete